MYVQSSRPFSTEVANTARGINSPVNTAYNALDMPRVRWNPYLATCKYMYQLITYLVGKKYTLPFKVSSEKDYVHATTGSFFKNNDTSGRVFQHN